MKYKKTKHEGIFSYNTKKGNRYRVRIVYDYEKEHSKSGFESLAEAQAYKATLESQLIVSGSGIFKGNEITLGQQWESYKAYKIKNQDWNLNTIENAEYKIKPFMDVLKNVPLNDITAKQAQRIIDDMYYKKSYSQETVQSYFNMLKQVLDDAVNDGCLVANKMAKVSYKKKGWKPTNKTIDLEDYKEFMKLAKENMRQDIFRCLYLLTFGLRRGEAYGIRQSSITFLPNGLAKLDINIQRTRNYMKGAEVKTRSSKRIVIVDEIASNMLKEQIEYAKIIKSNLNQIFHKDDFIFINIFGNPYQEKTLNKVINEITEMMENPVHLTPHMFRHMFTTYAIGHGANPLQLQTVLGHADLDMTSHYTGSSDEAAMKVLEITSSMRNIEG